jgi:hypothetical protein
VRDRGGHHGADDVAYHGDGRHAVGQIWIGYEGVWRKQPRQPPEMAVLKKTHQMPPDHPDEMVVGHGVPDVHLDRRVIELAFSPAHRLVDGIEQVREFALFHLERPLVDWKDLRRKTAVMLSLRDTLAANSPYGLKVKGHGNTAADVKVGGQVDPEISPRGHDR